MARKKSPRPKSAKKRPLMTRAEAREFMARWDRVAEHKRQEIRKMTPAEKLDTLDRLMQQADFFGHRKSSIADDVQIWMRWNRLREAHRG